MATALTVAQLSKSTAVPITTKKARPTRPKRSQMAFLTTEETLPVLKAARERSNRDWAMILLAYRHGLRASEACGLRLTDVNLKDGAISVEEPVMYSTARPMHFVWEPQLYCENRQQQIEFLKKKAARLGLQLTPVYP